MRVMYGLLLFLAALAAGCSDSASSSGPTSTPESAGGWRIGPGQPFIRGPDLPTAVPLAGVTDPKVVEHAFLSRPIRGQRPFRDVADYLDWLVHRPGTAGFTVEATSGPDGWVMHVTLRSADGRRLIASCPFHEGSRFYETGVLWDGCPELTQLWTAFAPLTFPTLAEARPYLPLARLVLFMPEPPPGTYRLTQVTLPATPEEARQNPFVVRMTFEDDGGGAVTLVQQPAGLNTAVYKDWGHCRDNRWPEGGQCRAWASKGAYFLLRSDSASPQTLQAFEHAIDSRR